MRGLLLLVLLLVGWPHPYTPGCHPALVKSCVFSQLPCVQHVVLLCATTESIDFVAMIDVPQHQCFVQTTCWSASARGFGHCRVLTSARTLQAAPLPAKSLQRHACTTLGRQDLATVLLPTERHRAQQSPCVLVACSECHHHYTCCQQVPSAKATNQPRCPTPYAVPITTRQSVRALQPPKA